ncbi:hypothetical protein BG003_009810 [Podila horticola]|nr:hypothetical protein BG003_009810 [Podila horticola]
MTGSATFYARANTSVAGGSTSSLVNGIAFPFTQQQTQQQQQQTANSIALANKTNQKRPVVDVEANLFAGAALEGFVGQMYSLCKDQHGCHYLQKKLEE